MDETQASIYGMFSGMDVLSHDNDYLRDDRIRYFSYKILDELGHPRPTEEEELKFFMFLNRINSLCMDILLK